MSQPVLDLSKYHRKEVHGDITLYMTWYGEYIEESEPALVLVPTYRIGHAKCVPFVALLADLWRYATSHNYLVSQAAAACICLGIEDTAHNNMRVGELIHGRLGDLKDIPPRPSFGEFVGAVMEVHDNDTGKITEHEVIDHH